jgi:hypothetical protein
MKQSTRTSPLREAVELFAGEMKKHHKLVSQHLIEDHKIDINKLVGQKVSVATAKTVHDYVEARALDTNELSFKITGTLDAGRMHPHPEISYRVIANDGCDVHFTEKDVIIATDGCDEMRMMPLILVRL